MSFSRLPYEVISMIVYDLNLEDVFHLSLSCRRVRYLTQDDRTCKPLLESLARGTAEARDAAKSGQWSRALRRLVQRRQAVRAAAPFTAAVVAVAESWLYAGGVLCHILERTLRVLDLHGGSGEETVVDIRGLLDAAVGGGGGGGGGGAPTRRRRRYKFQLLHYASGLVSCLYSRARPDPESVLVVFDVARRTVVTTSPPLESTYKMFVRNDADYLYYGTHSEFGEDGFRRWVLRGYNIKDGKWMKQKVHLVDMVGSDIGQSICFEIIDGYFYGLSNQTSFEVDEVDWTSYYHAFRFPVGDPRPNERSLKERMWRRQHAEGPIDDRWSFLRLIQNEETGQLQILESRKEWLDRRSSGQRTYYTTDLVWAPRKEDTEDDDDDDDATTISDGGEAGTAAPGSDNPDISSGTGGPRHILLNPRQSTTATTVRPWESYTVPAETAPPRPRDPHTTHIGDDASAGVMFTFSKCHIRSYHHASQAFLDLVDNPAPDDPAATPRLQLRAGARRPLPADEVQVRDDALLPYAERIRRLYRHGGANEITFWPPAPGEAAAAGAGEEKELEMLGRIVNPPTHVGHVKGVWDGRSFVYSTGSNADGVQAVVFLGFDPAVRLEGLRRWRGGEGGAVRTGEADNEDEGEGATADEKDHDGSEVVVYAPQGEEYVACAGEAAGEGSWGQQKEDDDVGKGKEAAAGVRECAASSSENPDGGDSPGTLGYSSGEESDGACSVSSTEHLQPQISIVAGGGGGGGLAPSGPDSLATTAAAMYRQIGCGYCGLPDFQEEKRIMMARAAAAAAAAAAEERHSGVEGGSGLGRRR